MNYARWPKPRHAPRLQGDPQQRLSTVPPVPGSRGRAEATDDTGGQSKTLGRAAQAGTRCTTIQLRKQRSYASFVRLRPTTEARVRGSARVAPLSFSTSVT